MDWQPIETAPRDGTHILVARLDDDVGCETLEITHWHKIITHDFVEAENGLYRKVERIAHEGWNGNGYRATHWQPLPSPPVSP